MAEELGKAQEMSARLQQAHSVERLFPDGTTQEGAEEIQKLDVATGYLRALANFVRV